VNIPPRLTAGNSATWTDPRVVILGDWYDATEWALAYVLRGPSTLAVDAVANGGAWVTSLTAAQTAPLQSGAYQWFALISKGDERLEAGRGRMQVDPDPLQLQAGHDPRTVAEIALADAEAALAGWSTSKGAVKRWRINGREQEFHDLKQILDVVAYWRVRVRNEQAAVAVANGQSPVHVYYARFIPT
jgi:hypothetical protein